MAEQPKQRSNIPPLDRFHEIEIEKVLDGIVATQNLRIQIASFFGTANLALLSIAFSTQKAMLLLFAGALIWVFLVIDMRTRRALAVYYYRSLQLQARFAPNDNDVYVSVLPDPMASWVRELSRVPQKELQINKLLSPPLRAQSVSAFWLPLIASIVEVGIGLTLWLGFSWPVF